MIKVTDVYLPIQQFYRSQVFNPPPDPELLIVTFTPADTSAFYPVFQNQPQEIVSMRLQLNLDATLEKKGIPKEIFNPKGIAIPSWYKYEKNVQSNDYQFSEDGVYNPGQDCRYILQVQINDPNIAKYAWNKQTDTYSVRLESIPAIRNIVGPN